MKILLRFTCYASQKCESNEWRIELSPKKSGELFPGIASDRSQQTRQRRQTNSAETMRVGIGNMGYGLYTPYGAKSGKITPY